MKRSFTVPFLSSHRLAVIAKVATGPPTSKRLLRSSSETRTLSSTADSCAPQLLHTEWIGSIPHDNIHNRARGCTLYVCLHGLLGNGRNLQTMARKLVAQQQSTSTNSAALLVDLPGHGKSKNYAQRYFQNNNNSSSSSSNGRTCRISIQDCADALATTLQNVLQQLEPPTTIQFVGHSLGGRIAMEYAATSQDKLRRHPQPTRLWLLDTVPGALDPSVLYVLQVAEDALNEQEPKTRKELSEYFQERLQDNDNSMALSQWLASSYDTQTHQFSFCIPTARSLIASVGQQDFLQQMRTAGIGIDLVRGANNDNWNHDPDTLSILEGWHDSNSGSSSSRDSQFRFHSLDRAGHWVHVDNLPGLLQIFKDHAG